MRKFLPLVSLLVVGLGWAYHHSATKAPQVATRVMAPAGTYYVLNYFATLTPNGLSGWTPGQQVSENKKMAAKKGSVAITDGAKSAVVPRTLLTQDVEIARTLRLADEATQEQSNLVSAALLAAEKARELTAAVETARRIERSNTFLLASSTIGTFRSRLNLPAYAASGGNGGVYRDERSAGSLLSSDEDPLPDAGPSTSGGLDAPAASGSIFAEDELTAAVSAARREASRNRGETIPSGLIDRMATDAFHLDYLGSREQ